MHFGFLPCINRTTLQFSESTVSDTSPSESVNLSREESYLNLEPLYFNSISRSSSERSGTGVRDVFVSPLGEATELLPIKVIAPEMQADIHELLTPVFEDYHRLMVSGLCKADRVKVRLCNFLVLFFSVFVLLFHHFAPRVNHEDMLCVSNFSVWGRNRMVYENSSAVLLHGTICFSIFYKMNIGNFLKF